MHYSNTASKRTKKNQQGQWRIGLGISALLLLTIAALLQKVPDFVLLLYLAMSGVAYSLYAYDKKAAQRGQWRISEQTLQQVALLCGSAGGFDCSNAFASQNRQNTFSNRLLVNGRVQYRRLVGIGLYQASE